MGFVTFHGSCTPEACFEETNVFVKASFYDYATKNISAPDSITLFGLGRETEKIYDCARGVKPALFPLDASTDNCKFIIRINGSADTLEFRYYSYPHLISVECGYTFYHNLDTILHTTNNIDYIFIGKRNISTVNEENIRIFY